MKSGGFHFQRLRADIRSAPTLSTTHNNCPLSNVGIIMLINGFSSILSYDFPHLNLSYFKKVMPVNLYQIDEILLPICLVLFVFSCVNFYYKIVLI